MIELSTHIEYMLLTRDEVSVPGLGTFISRDMSSRRVDEEGIFLPPYRTVSFKWDEQEAGEAFVQSLSKVHNLSRHDARMMCVEYVDELQQTLDEGGTASVGSMGYLIREAENGCLNFMPLQSGIASPAYYGLDAIPFSKLSHEVRQQRAKKQKSRKTKVTSVSTDQDTIIIRINRRVFNYVTAVAASIILFFTFTSPYGNPVVMNGGQKADTELLLTPKLVPAAKPQPKQVEQPTVAVAPKPVEEAPKAEPEVAKAEETPKAEVVSQQKAESPYVIVLACAISKQSALSMAGKLQAQGHKALACEFGGMVRVIIPSFATQEDAYAEIRRLKAGSDDFSHAWPCYVKEEIKTLE